MAYHRDKNYTAAARRERADDIADARFRQAVKAASDKELADIKANLEELISGTPTRHTWVLDRRQSKLGVTNQEISYRTNQVKGGTAWS